MEQILSEMPPNKAIDSSDKSTHSLPFAPNAADSQEEPYESAPEKAPDITHSVYHTFLLNVRNHENSVVLGRRGGRQRPKKERKCSRKEDSKAGKHNRILRPLQNEVKWFYVKDGLSRGFFEVF
jgi:hypothetical protein